MNESTRSTKDILDEWQACLDTMHRTPPNEEHFAASARIDELVSELALAIEREHAEALAKAESDKAAAESAAEALKRSRQPDVAKLLSDMRIAVWSVARALGAEQCSRYALQQIDECLADDLVQ